MNTAFKSRSAVAAITLGYRLFATNFKSLFKASWLLSLVFGLFCAAVGTILTVSLPSVVSEAVARPEAAQALGARYVGLLSLSAVLLVVGGLVEIVFYSCGFSLIGGLTPTPSSSVLGDACLSKKGEGGIDRPTRWFSFSRRAAWRTLKGVLATLLVLAVAVGLLAAFFCVCWRTGAIRPGSIVGLALFALIALAVVLVVGVPMLFVAVKYILTPGAAYWPTLWSNYRTAFAHYGFVFIVALFVGMAMLLATLILQLPALILSTANYQANLGVYYGDPLGMPGYVVPLSVAVFFLSGVMQAYIRMSAIFPLYYMYGSIETQEQEKLSISY